MGDKEKGLKRIEENPTLLPSYIKNTQTLYFTGTDSHIVTSAHNVGLPSTLQEKLKECK